MKVKQQTFSPEHQKELQKLCNQARGAILKMTSLAASGHPGGSMSTIDLFLTLYHMIEHDPKNPKLESRDRVVVSHGHIAPCVYSGLGLLGYLPLEDAISQFRLAGSIYEGHVEPDVPGVEWASGNLGQGLSAGCGFALASKLKEINNHVFVLMGDGEQQKGQLSEARRFAVKYNLHNLIGIIDYNKLQISGKINDVMPQNIKENYISDGWNALEIDGHDHDEIFEALLEAGNSDKPTVIIAHTQMGKGVSFMEDKEKYHGAALDEESLDKALQELQIENDLNYYKRLREQFKPCEPSAVQEEDLNLNTGFPMVTAKKTDNRSAWGNAIANIAESNSDIPIVVVDCDLQGSVKTKKFEEVAKDRFFQCGIMEHHAATMSGAISKEGLQVFFADFGVFGIDETYNQHRLNDINKTNLKVITTHVGLDVGEDGKTHQCIDYISLFQNLYGYRIIVPADPNQTDHIIRYVANKKGNYLIPMGRSKLDIITKPDGEIYFDEHYCFSYGKADKLRDGATAALMVMGTLAPRAVQISDILRELGIKLAVWNISSPQAIDAEALQEAAQSGLIFSYEDHNVNTGLGTAVANALVENRLQCELHKFGVDHYCCSGKSDDLFKFYGLDVDSMVDSISKIIKKHRLSYVKIGRRNNGKMVTQTKILHR